MAVATTTKSRVLSFIDLGRVIGAGERQLEATLVAKRAEYAKVKNPERKAEMKYEFTVGYIMAREGMAQRGAETIASLAKGKDQSDEGKKLVDAAWKKFEYWVASSGVKKQGASGAARVTTKDLTEDDEAQCVAAIHACGFDKVTPENAALAAQYIAAFGRKLARAKTAKTK